LALALPARPWFAPSSALRSSAVARCAANCAAVVSNAWRASARSWNVVPRRCRWVLNESLSSSMSGAETYGPPCPPTFTRTSPLASSARSASRTVTRLTPNCCAISRSVGSRSPGRYWPFMIARRIWAITSLEARVGRMGEKPAGGSLCTVGISYRSLRGRPVNSFDYHAPTSLAETFELLARYGEDAHLMAGGTALVLLLQQGLLQPGHVIGLRDVAELQSGTRRLDDGGLQIGALTTHRQAERSAAVADYCPALADTFARVATVRIRNQATIGGNLAHADPA